MNLVLRTEDGREVRARVRRDGRRHVVELEEGGRRHALDVEMVGGSLVCAGRQREVEVRRAGGEEGAYEVRAGGAVRRVEVSDPLTALTTAARVAGAAKRGGRVTAYMPGRVVSVLVEAGAAIAVGQGLIVLEAMKMQNEIQAERAGTVRVVHVTAGQSVDGGDLLFEIE